MRLCLKLFSSIKMPLKSFLFWFSNEQSGFRCGEMQALFKVFQIDLKYYETCRSYGPFVLMDLPSVEEAKQLMSRSVLTHSCIELWSSGDSMEELHENFKNNLDICMPYKDKSFCMRVETYGNTVSMAEKLEIIETFDYVPFEGPVDLKNPECSLQLIQYFGLDPNNVPEFPVKVFLGRWIANGQRHLMSKLSLKKRKFIGNTSMDPLLSLVMANLALVRPGDFVLDPFVGTGSLLVAAGVMGGYAMGTDIDYLMLHARTRPSRARTTHRAEDESVRANFVQYGVEEHYLDVLVADASRDMWRSDMRVDAIITDPPYGVREPTERIGSIKSYKIKEEHIAAHIPSKIEYSLTDIYCDLINFGAQRLKIGGRLVFWIPVSRDCYEEDKLPQNPCFDLVENSEQILTSTASRRLLVMEKKTEPTSSCMTVMDSTALMYRFKFFESIPTKTRKERKQYATETFGKGCRRGQMLPEVSWESAKSS